MRWHTAEKCKGCKYIPLQGNSYSTLFHKEESLYCDFLFNLAFVSLFPIIACYFANWDDTQLSEISFFFFPMRLSPLSLRCLKAQLCFAFNSRFGNECTLNTESCSSNRLKSFVSIHIISPPRLLTKKLLRCMWKYKYMPKTIAALWLIFTSLHLSPLKQRSAEEKC